MTMTTTTTTISNCGKKSQSLDRSLSPWKIYPSWQYDALVQQYGNKRVKLCYMIRHAEGTHNVNQEYRNIKHLDARLTKKGIAQCEQLQNELVSLRDEGSKRTDSNNSDNHDDYYDHNRKQELEHLIAANPEGNNKADDICVATSPLSRCIQTALISFEFLASSQRQPRKDYDAHGSLNTNETIVPFIGLEALRETVNYNCDRRRRIVDIAKDYPQIDFSFCQNNEDELWMSYRRQEQLQLQSQSSSSSSNTDHDKSSKTIIEKNHVESAQLYAVVNRGRKAFEFIASLSQSKVVICTHSAYLRCILNWGQSNGVPKMFDQWLDPEKHYKQQQKLFNYCYHKDDSSNLGQASFEEYMRKDYENAELRSFCLLTNTENLSVLN